MFIGFPLLTNHYFMECLRTLMDVAHSSPEGIHTQNKLSGYLSCTRKLNKLEVDYHPWDVQNLP